MKLLMLLFSTVLSVHKWTWPQEAEIQINTEKALYAGKNVTFDEKLAWHFLLHLFLALVWESSGSTHLSSKSSGWARITLISSLCSQSHANSIGSGPGDEVSVCEIAQVCSTYDLERLIFGFYWSQHHLCRFLCFVGFFIGNNWSGTTLISTPTGISCHKVITRVGHDSWRCRSAVMTF